MFKQITSLVELLLNRHIRSLQTDW